MIYDSLSQVYDLFTEDFDYPLWAEKYIELLHSKTRSVEEICDVGCGTGSILLEFMKRGLKVTGLDISEGMLMAAREKAMDSGFAPLLLRQDMREMRLAHRVDALVCVCDGINYLKTEKGAEAFFDRAFDSVKPGGAFAFDFSSEEKLIGLADIGLFAEEKDRAAYTLFCSREDRLVEMDLRLFVQLENGLYRRFAEKHSQRIWKPDEITAMLERAGFTDITIEHADLRGFGGDRIFVACIRP